MAAPFDFEAALPGLDRDKILAVEAEIKRWVEGRGYNPKSATLPGGYFLNSDELNEARSMLDEAYGHKRLVQQLGPGLLAEGGPPAGHPFQWVIAPGQADNRPLARMNPDRETIRRTDDPRIIALTQSSFNYRKERMAGGVADAIQASGSRIGLEYADILTAQKNDFMSQPGSRFIFDVETPSLDARHGLRQFSARVVDESGKQVKEFNLHFDKSIMGLGHWGPKTIKDVVGATDLLPDAQMAESMLEAFEWGAKSRYLVAQNGFFDTKFLLELGKSDLYQQGAAALEADPAAATTATRFKIAHDAFMAKTETADFYDTAAHARMQVGNLKVAPELAGLGSGKTVSISNILMQTSFLKDIEGMPDLETGRPMTARRVQELFDGSLHEADTDTLVTHYLSGLQQRFHAGEDVLRHVPLQDQALRKRLASSTAATISTGLPKEDLLELEGKGLIRFDQDGVAISTVSGKRVTITSAEQMMLLTRDLGMTSKSRGAAKVAAEGGWWGRFLEERNIFTPEGELSLDAKFPSIEEWATVQKQAVDKGLPFPGLSYTEREFSSILGASTDGPMDGGMARMRQLAGAELLVGEYQPSGLAAFPSLKRRPGPARNTAIPLSVLEQMEGQLVAGTDIPLLKGTKIGLARQGKAVQYARLSALNFGKEGGRTIQDVSFNIRALDADEAVADQQITGIIDFLKTKLVPEEQLKLLHGDKIAGDTLAEGMTPKRLAEYEAHLVRVEQGLRATGSTTGIQIGTVGGIRGGKAGAWLSSVMKERNYDTDWGSDAFVTPVTGDNRHGPILLARADSLEHPGVEGQVLSELNRQKGMYARAEQEVGRNPRLLGYLEGMQRVRGVGSAVVGTLEGYQKIRTWMTPKKAAVGAAVGAAGYYLYRRHKREPTDDILSQQPLEPTGFYEAYKADLGESPEQPRGRVSGGSQPHPLATAGITQQLHDQRIGHHRMGSDKNNHLF